MIGNHYYAKKKKVPFLGFGYFLWFTKYLKRSSQKENGKVDKPKMGKQNQKCD